MSDTINDKVGIYLERRLLKQQSMWPWTDFDNLKNLSSQQIGSLGVLLREQIEEQLCEFPQT